MFPQPMDILGGFSSESLKVAADGGYKASFFGDTGNAGLDRPLGHLEQYMMGVLPASEVPRHHGVSWSIASVNNRFLRYLPRLMVLRIGHTRRVFELRKELP